MPHHQPALMFQDIPSIPVCHTASGIRIETYLGSKHLIEKLAWDQLIGIERLVPAIEVFDSGVQCTSRIEEGAIDHFSWCGSVLIDIANCQAIRIPVITRIVHIQGFKNPLLYEVLIGLTGYLFDDVTEDPVTAITVD